MAVPDSWINNKISKVAKEPVVLGIMQPYFFPYMGYFSLIKSTSKWIVFDTPQYAGRSWMNRNRILDPNTNSWMYITVPVKKHALDAPLNTIEIHSAINWKEKIIGQLGYYKKRAPYYQTVVSFLKETLSTNFRTLSELNIHTLIATSAHLGVDFNYEIFSEMEAMVKVAQEADEWGLNICNALGVTDYINAEGGLKFMNKENEKYYC